MSLKFIKYTALCGRTSGSRGYDLRKLLSRYGTINDYCLYGSIYY